MTLHSRRLSMLLASVSLLAACASNPAAVQTVAPPPAAVAAAPAPPEPAPVTSLVEEVSIPHQKFVLDNGLTVLVHDDRKAPVVGGQHVVQCRLQGRARRARPASPICSSI